VRAALAKEGCAALAVSALDEICWLFNIRGGDVECNPVTVAYAIVTADEAAYGPSVLFIDAAKLEQPALAPPLAKRGGCGTAAKTTRVYLEKENEIVIRPYEEVLSGVKDTVARVLATASTATGSASTAPGAPALKSVCWIDPATTNQAIAQTLSAALSANQASSATPPPFPLTTRLSPIQLLKAVKNPVEIQGFRNCHIRDGAALVTFFAWLEAAVTRRVDLRLGPSAPLALALTEHSVCAVLDAFRAEQDFFVGLSFPTIAGMGPNGAVIHYRPEEATALPVTDQGVFLCDSGAQYLDGTTDVTRTLHFGNPTDYERFCYTRVLQGHIGMSRARFPPGTSGIPLDALARTPLWLSGLDYRHGTGHGVGSFLNVHEGPFGASPIQRTSYDGGIVAGMTLTDEPGYYEDGQFGIRIENVLIARECPEYEQQTDAATTAAKRMYSFGGTRYLEFEAVTMAPITTRLLDTSLLAPIEKDWLNKYHSEVRAKLEPLLQSRSDRAWAIDYLRRETESI
jgi:Xaa-Pro aminopeptidase